MNKTNTKKIALNGLLSAVTVLILVLASSLPTSRLSLYVLSSFLLTIVIIESGISAGWLFYMVSSLIALILLHNKLGVIPYILFFGLYGIVKYYIEKLNKMIPEFIIKLLFFNVVLFIAYFTMKNFLLGDVDIPIPLWVVAIILEIIFVVYDYVYTLFIGYYNTKLSKFVR